MGWEQRERGVGPYYYQSRRVGDRVQKVYRGGGMFGRLAAQLDEVERRQREDTAAYWKDKRARLEREAAFLRELEEAAETLARAMLVADGYRRHKGEWRMARD